MTIKTEMNDEALKRVNGGTFTKNSLAEERYHEAGIKTCYHFWDPDEFWLPDGTKTDMNGADAYVKETEGVAKFNSWYNEHHSINIYGNGCHCML